MATFKAYTFFISILVLIVIVSGCNVPIGGEAKGGVKDRPELASLTDVVEGELFISIGDDFENNRAYYKYHVKKSDGEVIELIFEKDEPSYLSGYRPKVRAKGKLDKKEKTLTVKSSDYSEFKIIALVAEAKG